MRTRGPLAVGLCLALMVALGGCDRETACGELQYDPATELCVCPEGTYFDEENGRCLLIDGGARDASIDAQVVDARVGEDSCALTTLHRDADGDGFGRTDMTMEACAPIEGWVADATDCDDECSACAPGAREICDGLDNDCDRVADDGVESVPYYADCDNDGYAAADAAFIVGCAAPPEPPSSCSAGTWTDRAPVSGETDCADDSADAFPGQTAWFGQALAGVPTTRDYDYNCDGVETKEITYMRDRNTYRACVGGGDAGTCLISGNAYPLLFGGPPGCGVIEELARCFDGCMDAWVPYRQRCR